ncbi:MULTISPECIES: hypothetical protein [Bacillus]|uniref:hypothetical protein n=1 Tax=Bacillus TaxID=1386 RepID=UPI00040BA7F5|nr:MULTISPECIES: hypothetical protein [Bacillus]QHZ46161.1 hypothetical protein M654_007585 [Bacillus sp. NSP9.1]WFA06385.1 hypothetical protein P3X63_06250 [Bacillus sp. HSf4]
MKKPVMAKADLIHDNATFGHSTEMSWLHLLLTENSFLHVQVIPEMEGKRPYG